MLVALPTTAVALYSMRGGSQTEAAESSAALILSAASRTCRRASPQSSSGRIVTDVPNDGRDQHSLTSGSLVVPPGSALLPSRAQQHRSWLRVAVSCFVGIIAALLLIGVALQFANRRSRPIKWPEWVPSIAPRPPWVREQEAAASLRAGRLVNPLYWDTQAVWEKARREWAAAPPGKRSSEEPTTPPGASTSAAALSPPLPLPQTSCHEDESQLLAEVSPPEFPSVPSAYWG